MTYYDFEKAKQIIKSHKKNELIQVSLGMKEDWYWTADTIWEDGKYLIRLNDKTYIGGINGSTWATPIIELRFKDGSLKMFDCYK